MYYVLSKNGVMVGVTKENAYAFNLQDVSIHEFDGDIPDLNSSTWDAASESIINRTDHITRLNFLNRFTIEERITIRASTNPVVFDIMNLLEAAQFVDVNDHSTIQGVNYLASVQLLTQNRVQEILK